MILKKRLQPQKLVGQYFGYKSNEILLKNGLLRSYETFSSFTQQNGFFTYRFFGFFIIIFINNYYPIYLLSIASDSNLY